MGKCRGKQAKTKSRHIAASASSEFGAGNAIQPAEARSQPIGSRYQQKSRHIAASASSEFGAGNEIRTRDPNLGKVVLYQLSYSRITITSFKKWHPQGDSNPCYRRERAVS